MERQQELRVIVEQEANGIANIFLLAHGLPSEMRTPVQRNCDGYTQAVIYEEWEAMNRDTCSPRALQCAWALFRNITEMQSKSTAETTLHYKLLDRITEMADMRRTVFHRQCG